MRSASLAVSLAAATVCAQSVIAAELVLVTHHMPASRFSEIVIAISVAMVCALFFDFGSNLYSVREIARGSLAPHRYAERLVIKVLIATSLSCGAVLFWGFFGSVALVAGSCSLFVAQVSLQGIAVPFRAVGRASTPAWLSVGSRLLGFGSLFCLGGILESSSLVIAVLVCQDLLGLGVAAAVGRGFGLLQGVRPALCSPWSGSSRYGFASLGVGLAQLDVVVLGATAGAPAAGIYGAVNRWVQPFNMLAASVAITVTPLVAQDPTLNRLWQAIRSHRMLLGSASLGAVGVALCSDWIVGLLLGEGYKDAASPLLLLGFGVALAVWSQPLAATMQALGRERLVAWLLPSASVARLVTIALTAETLSANAAAASYVAAQAGILIALSVAVWRGLRLHGKHYRDRSDE